MLRLSPFAAEPSRDRQCVANRLRRLQDYYTTQTEEAEQLTEVGDLPVAADVDRGELASYTGVCLLILNLDESLSK